MRENLTAQPPVRRGSADDRADSSAELPSEPSGEPVDCPPVALLVGEVFLPCDEYAPTQARRILTATLDVWGLSDVLETAGVVLQELVTNAVRHAGGRQIGVTLWRRLTLIHISVRDCSRALPCVISTGPFPTTAEGGRGLQLVDAYTFRWGAELLPGGKRVWAELAA
jgi:hypothetical protein